MRELLAIRYKLLLPTILLSVYEEAARVFNKRFPVKPFWTRPFGGRGNGGIIVSSLQVEKSADAVFSALSEPTAHSILICAAFFDEQPPSPEVTHSQTGRGGEIVKVAVRPAIYGEGDTAVPGCAAVIKGTFGAVPVLALIIDVQAHAEVRGGAMTIPCGLVFVVTAQIQLHAETEKIPVSLGEVRTPITVATIEIDEESPPPGETERAVGRLFAEDTKPRSRSKPETIVLIRRVLRMRIRRVGFIVRAGIPSAAFVGIVPGYIDQRADTQRRAEAQRVAEAGIPVVSCAIHQ